MRRAPFAPLACALAGLVGVVGLASCQDAPRGATSSRGEPASKGTLTASPHGSLAGRAPAARTVPVTIDLLSWFPTAELVASDGVADAIFGTALAVSGDTLVVGSPNVNLGQPSSGAAYLFVQSSPGTWTQQQLLVADDASSLAGYGIAVAIDGDTAVVGASEGSTGVGGATVFVRSAGSWVQQQDLVPSAQAQFFGTSVAVSGSTVLVGAPGGGEGPPGGSQDGAAYFFTRTGSTWSQLQVVQSGGTADGFGMSVALQGSTAVVGAGAADLTSGTGGTAYVYVQSGSTFVQQQQLAAADGAAGDYFGSALAVDGTTVLVGAPGAATASTSGSGAVYAFVQSGGVFAQQQKIVPTDGVAGDLFGASIALAGSDALVGTRFDAQGAAATPPGHAYAMKASGGVWALTQRLTAPGGAPGDSFGGPVALDGTYALIGAPGATVGPNLDQGSVYVETLLATPSTTCTLDAECGSGHCVDGVCCDLACTSQCQACDVTGSVGTCTSVTGPPHGTRAACTSVGPACGGACDGVHGAACAFPQIGTPCATTCTGSDETASACDGDGTCVAGEAGACRDNLACDPSTNACHTSCAVNGDCAPGYLCNEGACAPGTSCVDGHTSLGPTGTQDCGTYACDAVTGQCDVTCTTVDDCSAPSVCDPSGACVAPPDTSTLSGGCSVGRVRGARGEGSAPMSRLALALALLGLASVRARASRRSPGPARPGSSS